MKRRAAPGRVPRVRRHVVARKTDAQCGAVLVAVLGGVLLVAAILFAAIFAVTLETMGARSAARAALNDAAQQGALSLAVAELVAGSVEAPAVLGPWPDLGIGAQVLITVVAPDVVALETRLEQTNAAPARLTLALGPEPHVLWRP